MGGIMKYGIEVGIMPIAGIETSTIYLENHQIMVSLRSL
jgi:hypothetical protein